MARNNAGLSSKMALELHGYPRELDMSEKA
jgi:hypothetical protein